MTMTNTSATALRTGLRKPRLELDDELAAAVKVVIEVRRLIEPFDLAARARIFFYVADYFHVRLGETSRP